MKRNSLYSYWKPILQILIFSGILITIGCESLRYQNNVIQMTEQVQERLKLDPSIQFSHELSQENIQSIQEELLSKELTLDSAVRLCLIGNPTLMSYYEELGIAQAELLKAKALPNPKVHADILESHEEDVIVRGIQLNRERDVQFHFSLVIDLLDLILKPERIQVSKAQFDLLKMNLSHKVMDVIGEVVEGVYAYQGEQQIFEVLEQIYEGAQSKIELALEQHKAGNNSDLALVRHQINYQNSKLHLADQGWKVKVARERINKLLGLWGENIHWKINAPLPMPTDLDVAKNLEHHTLNHSITLESAKIEINILKRLLSLEKKEIVPALEAGFARDAGDGHKAASGGTFGVEIPIFDRNQGEIERVKALIRKKEREMEALAIALRSESRLLQEKFSELTDKIAYYQSTILPAHKREVELAQLHYNGMFIGAYELMDVKNNELEVQKDFVNTLKEYWITRSKIDHAFAGGHVGGESVDLHLPQSTNMQKTRGHGH